MDFAVIIYFVGAVSSTPVAPTVIGGIASQSECVRLAADLSKSNSVKAECYASIQSDEKVKENEH